MRRKKPKWEAYLTADYKREFESFYKTLAFFAINNDQMVFINKHSQ